MGAAFFTPTEEYWITHLKRNNKADLIRIEQKLGDSILIDVSKIIPPKMWEDAILNPRATIGSIITAARELIAGENKPKENEIKIKFMHVSHKKTVRDLRVSDEDKLISITCLVKRTTPVRPKLIEASFKCENGHTTLVKESYGRVIAPWKCSVTGCNLKNLKYAPSYDKKINHQYIYVQELLDELQNGLQPSTLKCEVVDEMCNEVVAGDRVTINGFLRTIPRFKDKGMDSQKDFLFEINYIERGERDFKDVTWTDKEEEQILEWSQDPEIFARLTKSMAPALLGMEMAKKVLLLSLFEGVDKVLEDGSKRRGYINVLIVTDPGMAKTELGKFLLRVAVRASFAVASTSTKVGLVAPVVKDENTGEAVLECGPYLLASGGHFILDEANELGKDDVKYLGEGMENGQFHIAKMGINADVPADAAIIMLCNPNKGNYDPYLTFSEQLNFPPQILSRLDLKLLMTDTLGEDFDDKLQKHIGNWYRKSGMKQTTEIIPAPMLRKYFAYAHTVDPILTEEVCDIIGAYYKKVRKESSAPGKMKITVRQLNTLYIMAEARARMSLSSVVTQEQAQEVIDLFDLCLHNINTGSDGQIDMSRSERGRKKARRWDAEIKQIITNEGGKCSSDVIKKELKQKYADVSDGQIDKQIEQLYRENIIMDAGLGKWRVV